VVVVHSGKSKMCVRVCADHSMVTVGQHAEVCELLRLLSGFVDFCNFAFIFQVK
jgi:hypothetical protein